MESEGETHTFHANEETDDGGILRTHGDTIGRRPVYVNGFLDPTTVFFSSECRKGGAFGTGLAWADSLDNQLRFSLSALGNKWSV